MPDTPRRARTSAGGAHRHSRWAPSAAGRGGCRPRGEASELVVEAHAGDGTVVFETRVVTRAGAAATGDHRHVHLVGAQRVAQQFAVDGQVLGQGVLAADTADATRAGAVAVARELRLARRAEHVDVRLGLAPGETAGEVDEEAVARIADPDARGAEVVQLRLEAVVQVVHAVQGHGADVALVAQVRVADVDHAADQQAVRLEVVAGLQAAYGALAAERDEARAGAAGDVRDVRRGLADRMHVRVAAE